MAKILNFNLIVETFFGRRVGAPFPTNRVECKLYALELAEGLSFWATLDVISAIAVLLLWAAGVIVFTPIAVLAVVVFFFGCPLIMTAGMLHGRLQYLTLREVTQAVRQYFSR